MIDIKDYLKKNIPKIDAAIEKYIPKSYDEEKLQFTLGKPSYKYNVESTNKAIAEPIWELLERGGKRWRPTLLLLICEALGGDSNKIFDLVVIPEVVHNGTLMVDDVEDKSDLRRGKPCIHKIFGEDIAINAGNAMYFLPLLVLLKNKGIDEKAKVRIYEVYIQEMINLSFGQGMDIAWHNGMANADEISEEEYLQMCAYKTGCLARMAAKIGAIAANASDEVVERVGKLAESIGVGFQIQDDILNLTARSNEAQFVKEYIGSDITEGKRTLMVIHTLKNANEEDKKRLIEILNMHTKDRNLIDEAIEIIKKYDSINYAKKLAKKIIEEAWKDVEPSLKESEAKNILKEFVKFCVEREI